MKLGPFTRAAVASLALSGAAAAQEAPSRDTTPPETGVDLLAGGIALGAFGVLSLATAPICETSVVIPLEQSACLTTSVAVGAPVLATGITLIVIGAVQRAKYKDWVRRHPALQGLSFAAASGGAAFGWSATF